MPGWPGYKGKIELGILKVAEMGAWNISGQENEMLEDTELTDEQKTFIYGRTDGGTVTFNGNYDPTDANGQEAFLTKWKNKSATDEIFLYFGKGDNNFFFCKGNANCYVQTVDGPSVDQSGIGTIGFTLKVSGGYLVKATAAFTSTDANRLDFSFDTQKLTKTSGTSFSTLGFSAGGILTVKRTLVNDKDFTISVVTANQITVSSGLENETTVSGARIMMS